MGWIPCYTRTAPQLHGWRALSAPLPEPSPEHKSLLPPEKRDALIATHLCPLHQSDHEDQTSGPMRDQCEIVRTHLGLTSCWSGPIKSRGQRGTWVSCYRTAWAAILLLLLLLLPHHHTCTTEWAARSFQGKNLCFLLKTQQRWLCEELLDNSHNFQRAICATHFTHFKTWEIKNDNLIYNLKPSVYISLQSSKRLVNKHVWGCPFPYIFVWVVICQETIAHNRSQKCFLEIVFSNFNSLRPKISHSFPFWLLDRDNVIFSICLIWGTTSS